MQLIPWPTTHAPSTVRHGVLQALAQFLLVFVLLLPRVSHSWTSQCTSIPIMPSPRGRPAAVGPYPCVQQLCGWHGYAPPQPQVGDRAPHARQAQGRGREVGRQEVYLKGWMWLRARGLCGRESPSSVNLVFASASTTLHHLNIRAHFPGRPLNLWRTESCPLASVPS